MNKGNGGFKCQARIASQEETFLLEILKRRGRQRSFLLGVAVLTKVMPSHSDPRPVRLLLLGIPLIKEQERSKGSAVGIRPVGKGLLNPDSLLEMSKF